MAEEKKDGTFELEVGVTLVIVSGLGVKQVLDAGFYDKEHLFFVTLIADDFGRSPAHQAAGVEITSCWEENYVRRELSDAVKKGITTVEFEVTLTCRLTPRGRPNLES